MTTQSMKQGASRALREVDVCMIVDTTGSMGPFLELSKRELLQMAGALSQTAGISLRMGLVEFRDHPPQENTFVTRMYDMTADLKRLKKELRGLRPSGGGDEPEAVYQGVYDACVESAWREHSVRFGFLVGDAPPHGFAAWSKARRGVEVQRMGDGWPSGCPSGLDLDNVCAAAEQAGVRIYGLLVGGGKSAKAAFEAIAEGTGGRCFACDAKKSLAQIKEILEAEFASIDFDQQVWDAVHELGKLDAEAVAESLDCPRVQVAASIARMGARGLWKDFL